MANHVYFNIDLSLDAGQTTLVENLGEMCKTEEGEMKWISYEIEKLPIYPVPYKEEDWYSWGCENMGAKWVSTEEWHEYGMSGHSAWSPPIPFVENLIQYIFDELGGNPSARMTYEDEFRNFVGVMECWIDEDTGKVNHDICEADGSEFVYELEQWSGWNTNDEHFEWWEEKLVQGGGHYEPQEVLDEMVYGFFEDCIVKVRHD